MQKIRFGIVGVGNQGSYYANIFKGCYDDKKIDNGVLTALCDNDETKLEKARDNYASLQVSFFSDYKEMLSSGLVDVVLVEVPHYQHPEIVTECLKRGINVICDKPAGVYTKQVREMNEVAKKSTAKFGMMFNQRTNCVYRKMRELLANGEIGEIQRVNWVITDWFRTQNYYDSGSWRATWKGEGGGVLINQCPHQIDLVQWIVGEMPIAVRGFCKYGRWHDIEVEDEVTAFFEYKNGATGTFITTTGEAPGTNRLEISGTKGKLVCEVEKLYFYRNEQDSQAFSKTEPNGFTKPKMEKIEVETDEKNPQHVGIINNFANALLGLEKQFVEGADGINGVELMNAIELSGWNDGEKITLPIDETRYYNELQQHCLHSKEKEKTTSVVTDTAGSFGTK